MNVEQLVEQCKEKIKDPIADGKISLMIPGHAGRGNTKCFPGTRIRGELICEYDGRCLCSFDAQKILNMIEEKLKEKG